MRDEEIDWSLTSFEGLRRHQAREFLALPLREKILVIERMCELADRLQRPLTPQATKPPQAREQP